MTPTQLLVMAFCAVAGYWIVSALLGLTGAGPRRGRDDQQDGAAGRRPGAEAAGTGGWEDHGEARPRLEAAAGHWSRVLQVAPDASADEIRRAYKTLISQYHPDKVASLGEELRELAETKSKALNVAYDQARRARGMP